MLEVKLSEVIVLLLHASRIVLIVAVIAALAREGGLLRAGADEVSDLKAVVDRYYGTLAKKDLEGHLALWVAGAENIADYRKATSALLDANDDLKLRLVKVLKQKIEKTAATLQVYSEMTASRQDGKPSPDFGKRVVNFQFVKDSDAWKVKRATDAVRDLVEALMAAKTRRDRQSLLDADRTIVGPDLVVSMNVRAENLAREKSEGSFRKLDEALQTNDVAYEVAAFLLDKALGGVCFTSRGLIFAAAGKHPEAVQQYQRALEELRDAKDKVNEALTLNYLGISQLELKNSAEATKSFEQSVQIIRSLNNKTIEGLVLGNLAATHERMENFPAALTAYEGCAEAYRAANDKANESRVLVTIGNLQRGRLKSEGSFRKPADALKSYEAALALRKELDDKPGAADVLMGIGAVHHELGDAKKAAASFASALQIVRGLDNKKQLALALNNLGLLQTQLKDYPAAIASLEESAKLHHELDEKTNEARLRVSVGNAQREAKRLGDAQSSYETGLKLLRELKDTRGEADVLIGLGAVFAEQGASGKAASSFESALQVVRDLKDRALEALTLNNLGAMHEKLKNQTAALTSYEGALAVYRELKDKANESRMLVTIGNMQRAQKKPKEALASYEAALKLKRELGEKVNEATILMGIGALHHEAGDAKKATDSFEAALHLVREQKDKPLEAATLSSLGALHEQLKDLAAALAAYEGSAKLYRELAGKAEEARALVSVGNIQRGLKKDKEAAAAYEASLKLYRELGDKRGEADLLIGLGAIYHQQGDTKKATDTFESALKVVREAKNRALEAVVLGSLAAMHERLNNDQAALEAYNESIKAFREGGDKAGEARSLVNAGNVELRLGKRAEAIAKYEESLKLKQEIQDKPGEADLLMGLGLVYFQQGNLARATSSFEASLAISRTLGNKSYQASALTNLATLYEQTDSLIPALASYDETLKLYRDLGDRGGEVRALVGLGNVQRGMRNQSAALNSYEEALKLAASSRDTDNQFRCHLGKSLIFTTQSKWTEARAAYRQCLSVLNAAPLGLQFGTARALALGDRRALRDNLALTSLQLHATGQKPEGDEAAKATTFLELAFAEVEARRALGLADLLDALGVQVKEGATAQQMTRERELAIAHATNARDLLVLLLQPGDRDEKKMKELEDKQRTTEKDHRVLVTSLRETKYGKLRYPEAATVADARKALPANGAILSYHVLPDQTVLFVVTKTAYASKPLSITRAALARKVSDLLAKMSAAATPLTEVTTASEELYKLLVAPAAPELKGVKRLIVIPDGPLTYLPFAALVTGTDPKDQSALYIIDEYAVSTAPSLSALIADRESRPKTSAGSTVGKPPAQHALLAFADPEVTARPARKPEGGPPPSGAGESAGSVGKSEGSFREPAENLPALQLGASEAQAAAALFKPRDKVYVGREATAERAKAEGANARLLLLASPVRLGDDDYSALGIPLTKGKEGDGLLGPQDLVNWKLAADLVVLSGGHAVPGKLASGDSLNIICRALQYAGAHSVAISLWRVNDPSRVKLTSSLLATVKEQQALPTGFDNAEALRTAQLKLRRAPATAHPFHWAAFVLSGDWH